MTSAATVAQRLFWAWAVQLGAAFRRRSDSGVDCWLRSDDTSIYRVAGNMSYTIEAPGEKVQTRAGRFNNCLRVNGAAVRLVREEPAQATFLTGGMLTTKLIAWQ